MLVSVVQIGNSRGIRLPKAILEQLHIEEKLDLEIDNQRIILKPVEKQARSGWAEAFQSMARSGEDILLPPGDDLSSDFEWEW